MPEPFDWSAAPADPNDRLLGQLVSTSESNAARSEVILYGLPFDGAVIGRKGAAGGPKALRTAVLTLKAYHYASGELRRRVYDMGDEDFSGANVEEAHARAEAIARKAHTLSKRGEGHEHARVIALGGDHSLAYPCILPYLEEQKDRLAVINFDAHLDVRMVRANEEQNSGTAFGRLLDKGLASYTVIGARDFQTSPAYARRVEDGGAKVLTAREVFALGVEGAAREVFNALPPKCHTIYLSIDVDVADASVAPGVSAPTPGGLLAHQVFDMIRIFASDPRVSAGGIFELAPNLEEPGNDRTARFAAGCLAEMLAAM